MNKTYTSTIYNLNNEWMCFHEKTGMSKAEASRQMGWSVSFFGSILRGSSSLSLENLIKISNFMQISPKRIDLSYLSPSIDSYEIHGTTSGAEPPAGNRSFKQGQLQFWVDRRVPIYKDGRGEKHRIQYFEKGLTLFCTEEDVPQRVDDIFVNDSIPYWLVFKKKGSKTISICSTKKPHSRLGKIYRIVGLYML